MFRCEYIMVQTALEMDTFPLELVSLSVFLADRRNDLFQYILYICRTCHVCSSKPSRYKLLRKCCLWLSLFMQRNQWDWFWGRDALSCTARSPAANGPKFIILDFGLVQQVHYFREFPQKQSVSLKYIRALHLRPRLLQSALYYTEVIFFWHQIYSNLISWSDSLKCIKGLRAENSSRDLIFLWFCTWES